MQVDSAGNVNFTSVIPVKVISKNEEILDARIVQKACREAIKAIAGPLQANPQYKPAAAQLAVMDPDYRYARALFGYKSCIPGQQSNISNFFKIIYDRNNKGYIVTGKESDRMSLLGKAYGKTKKSCKYGLLNPDEIKLARDNYWKYIAEIGNNLSLRIKEAFSSATREKLGNFQQMEVHIKTKPIKIKGIDDTKVTLENITFSDKI